MPRSKDVLTTGEVARLCNVAPRTVSKWFDSGRLRGYKIPGSKDRRIPIQQLVRFMKSHGIPLNGLDAGLTRVLVAEGDTGVADLLARALSEDAGYDVRIARSAFEAGVMAEILKPHVMLLDLGLSGLNGRETVRSIRANPDLETTRIIAVTPVTRDGEAEAMKQQGFDGTLVRPFDVSQAVTAIEAALAPQS